MKNVNFEECKTEVRDVRKVSFPRRIYRWMLQPAVRSACAQCHPYLHNGASTKPHTNNITISAKVLSMAFRAPLMRVLTRQLS